MTMLSVPTTWRRNAVIIDMVEIITSLHLVCLALYFCVSDYRQ